MGLTASTSLSKLGENEILRKFVGPSSIPEDDAFWKELLTFSYAPPKSMYVSVLWTLGWPCRLALLTTFKFVLLKIPENRCEKTNPCDITTSYPAA